ncbi:hypothetical protein AB0K43_24315 [Kitasatospora sp. NPDC049258]|uniref:hypothetical protein n=1 Tax=Kitasatospora sp. NPDC049258 TaxID=3155394 RepID=UPI00343707FA
MALPAHRCHPIRRGARQRPRRRRFTSAAFAITGHDTEAYQILQYNQQAQSSYGTWEARTKLDGSGPPDGQGGIDSAAAFTAPPFNTAPADLGAALDQTYNVLKRPNGGAVPGSGYNWGTDTWSHNASFFSLAWYGTGQSAKGGPVLDWVLSKRNNLGELPETVNAAGKPSSVVPLGWTDALVLMSLVENSSTPMPTPPLQQP